MDLIGRFRSLEYFHCTQPTKQRLLAKLHDYLPLDVRDEFFRQHFPTSRDLADFVEKLAELPERERIEGLLGYLCGFSHPASRDEVFDTIRNWFMAKGRTQDFNDALAQAATRIKAEIAFAELPTNATPQPN